MKRCTGCKEEKPLSEFPRWNGRTPDNYSYRCKVCTNTFRRKWYWDHLETERAKYAVNRRKYRSEMIAAYGGKCACCGEPEPKFLALDHVNGGGAKERKKYRNTIAMIKMLRDSGWPKERYQLLCHNCNCAKGFYGQCPHKTRLGVAV